ncbi:hypothetical protein VC83_08095 [Pseudogymnoascus destructans]|uniref:Cytochrome P450 n=2 Tax=Pseudogymnoascus destructans TaxID=655981 RepID=L8FTS2_PSED2|nr:uncharacterized protein VC83_08095 [Pseudogymnoascus destructans]ELR04287.1 hypothetical protein GMDG_06683 [Pseudogymnoascus destructans 20631-21]OAF55889.1 hypothetical protein VC83_08095 [Pseudogymnoascus destructans]
MYTAAVLAIVGAGSIYTCKVDTSMAMTFINRLMKGIKQIPSLAYNYGLKQTCISVLGASFLGSIPPSTPALSTLAYIAGGIVLLYLAYWWALPKPIPGIPYNKPAIKLLLGDVGSMVKHISKTQEVHDWMSAQNVKLNSPIVQLFTRPFGRPCVVVTNYLEAQDILVHRTKEFDRSKFIADVSGGIVSKNHFVMQTNDEFRKHHKWVQGIMATGFLQDVAAPYMYEAGQDLLQLWEQKARLAKGRAFVASHDVHCTTMDAVWPIVFGADPVNSNTKAQLRLYTTIKDVELPNSLTEEAVLPRAPHPEMMAALKKSIRNKMFDEILGFTIGAQDTTSTSITWALKYLADNPDVQTKLRAELRGGHADAASERRMPTFDEITKTQIHYRDAVIEEIFRCSQTEASAIRTAVVDTEILGHFIPKGTEVFLMGNGPSFLFPEFEIQDSLRTKLCLESKGKVGAWKHDNMASFNPDRWMVQGPSGKLVFDAAAGPMLTFGLGEHGCYGQRMAYLQMRQLLSLIVWKFELYQCPKELSRYAASDNMAHSPQFCYIQPAKFVY